VTKCGNENKENNTKTIQTHPGRAANPQPDLCFASQTTAKQHRKTTTRQREKDPSCHSKACKHGWGIFGSSWVCLGFCVFRVSLPHFVTVQLEPLRSNSCLFHSFYKLQDQPQSVSGHTREKKYQKLAQKLKTIQ
jgi:hypothetical protein